MAFLPLGAGFSRMHQVRSGSALPEMPSIDAVCAAKGLKAPIICTPEELWEA